MAFEFSGSSDEDTETAQKYIDRTECSGRKCIQMKIIVKLQDPLLRSESKIKSKKKKRPLLPDW